MARLKRPQAAAVTVAFDVEGAGRGSRYLERFVERFKQADTSSADIAHVRVIPVMLPPHDKALPMDEALPIAFWRATEARAAARARLGLGMAPIVYEDKEEKRRWTLSVAVVVDKSGLLCWAPSSGADHYLPSVVVEEFNEHSYGIAQSLLSQKAVQTLVREDIFKLSQVLCSLATEDLVMRVPLGSEKFQ